MKRCLINKCRGAVCLVFCFMLAVCFTVPSSAVIQNGETVTVAYIDYNNFITKQKDGTYTGYGADYLNKISEYAGWNYKYVDMDWPTAYKAVKNGMVDFYCVARQTEERQQSFDFSTYPVCSEEMNIYAMPKSQLYYEDFSSFDGLRVGMLEGSGEIDYFKDYAGERGFDYELVEYPMNEDAVEGLKKGEVDIIALVNYSVNSSLKLVGNFGVSPAYMMSCEGSSKMDEFSRAQERLYFDNPSFEQELETKYYGNYHQEGYVLLTREEAKYIDDEKTLTVALSKNMAPIEYYDEKTNEFRGASVDIYKEITRLTGLKFRFVERKDSPVLISQMKEGKVQLTGALAQSDEVEKSLMIKQTRAFSESSFTIVAENVDNISSKSIVAVPAGYPQFYAIAKDNGYKRIKEYDNFNACINAVNKGDADITYVISLCSGYLLNHVQYSDLQSMDVSGTEYGICFGIGEQKNQMLLKSILDKSIAAVSKKDINEIIVSNTSTVKPKQNFRDIMAKNGMIIFLIAVLLVAGIAYVIIRGIKGRQQNEINRKLKEHHDFLQHLYDTLPCGVFQYSYEAPHNIINFNKSSAQIYGYENENEFMIEGEEPNSVVKSGTADDFSEKFKLCEEQSGIITYTWPITKKDGSDAFTECVMDIVETQRGKVFQEVFIDVTERVNNEKQMVKRYSQEIRRNGSKDEELLYTACFDIDEQILTETDIDVPGIHDGMTVKEFVEGLRFELEDLQTEEAMADFETRFTRERLEADYENGKYDQSFDLCRYCDGQIQWLQSELVLRLNPVTGHLMCFDYIRDVTDERITDEIVRRLAFADCESFMSIFMATGRCLQYEVGETGKLNREKTKYGKTDVVSRMKLSMTENDIEELEMATRFDVIRERLEKNPHYQIFATLTDKSGERRDKALTFFYTNKENEVLAVTTSDVTQVRADEVRHAKLLAEALEAAKKADEAKSQFLSRVSHEMRTPLNAIIGFIELAKDAGEDKTADYLASSDIAAKQLLDVINDVLDMSSIESGKMKIAKSSFNFRHIITSITNIYGTQCKQKGLDFATRIATPIDDWLVGDEMRVNQILMNLLGNAVKFTSKGSIALSLSQRTGEGNDVFIKFSVADTGSGMSDEMKERLFKPFEQESSVTAKKYGGSGLGLSIVKNLVSLMGGSVSVESVLGQGTEFIVELPFQRSEVKEEVIPSHKVEDLRVLVIDDEETEREYLGLVLMRLGVRYTCVAGGTDALEKLEKADKEGDLFNICLVDWMMPEMDGCDTTKNIRSKYGEDVVVIVVSAYDFQQAGDSAREAGANLFLSKPIFQSALFDLFMTLTEGSIAKVETKAQEWDFAGKRVLLAEDNLLNQIVAKGYLARYNIVVDLAADGKEALDMFTASEPGHYDAILMDVQMPVMDGIEATKAIRKSGHQEAETIQIIAQTADAFNEDITRVISAGMNAHVAKPIKPDVLAKELHRAFTKGKTEG